MGVKMRVLSIQHYPIFGGPHNEILRLQPEMERLGVKIIVAHSDEPGNAAQRLIDHDVEVHKIPLRRLRQSWNPLVHLRTTLAVKADVAALRELIRGLDIDVVKVHGPHNPIGAIAAKLEHKPLTWVVSSSRVPKGFRTIGGYGVSKLADSVLVNGYALLDIYPGLRNNPRIFVYYPPVDTEQFIPSQEVRGDVRSQLNIPSTALVVGMVANFNPQKGVEYFVRAARSIYEAIPGTYFLIVGAEYATQQAYAGRIHREIRCPGVPLGQFILTGERKDVERMYPAMDVKVITSIPRSEGTTTTAMEAMACGLPVIAYDVGAIREVVQDGITGIVIRPLDVQGLANATVRLLHDSSLRGVMGSRGRLRAVDLYDIKLAAEGQLRAFEAACGFHDVSCI